MKKKTLTFAVLGLIAGTLFTSCATKQENAEAADDKVMVAKAEAKEAHTEADNEKSQSYAQFKADAQQQIKQNDAKIEALKTSKRTTSGNDAAYKEKINILKEKNKKLEEKLNTYDAGEKNEWQTFKAEFAHDMNEIAQAFIDLGNDSK